MLVSVDIFVMSDHLFQKVCAPVYTQYINRWTNFFNLLSLTKYCICFTYVINHYYNVFYYVQQNLTACNAQYVELGVFQHYKRSKLF